MRSYFVRHTERISVRNEDLRKLWDENRIAIHYPAEKSGMGQEDSRSLNPEDYYGKQGRDRTAISRLVELAKDGGYVWTESFVSEDKTAKAGYVKPGTRIELRDVRWGLRGRDEPKRKDGDPAVLKTAYQGEDRTPPRAQVGLRAGRPQQGTILRWDVGERLARFVQGQPPMHEWANLSTAQHEAVCAEYLREKHEGRPELPRLSRLLLPAGRALQDVDLHGLADDGREVFGQVTYHPRGSAPVKRKLAALKPYGKRGAHLVFFCRGTGPRSNGGVHFVSCEAEVMPWLDDDDGYAGA
ncbi:MAG: hypothetical protein CYG60_23310, partial [Actinobacteria bacterium]